jgi:single-stranded-DNA-specific exonuclease
MPTRYQLRETPPPTVSEALRKYSAPVQALLYSRGITTANDAETYLALPYETALHDPFLLPDMHAAVSRILGAMDAGEQIAIWNDYDCDGIPGGVLMRDFFSAINYPNVTTYIPHRHEEGYGLNTQGIDALTKKGVTLLITVDCGITDNDAVLHAATRGMDVIVTDHHEPGPSLPAAHAVINPKRSDHMYPFRELCGSGVAFKLICALLASRQFPITAGREKWWLDVVGLATIADMVPLIDENRTLAHYGLLVMRKNRRLGLSHLFRTMRMDPRTITEDDIGFMIAPRINAASRMGMPEDAFNLLRAEEEGAAGAAARHLERINNERKGVVAAMVKDIRTRIGKLETIPGVLVVGDPLWRPALVGLAANALLETYARPVFIWGRDGRSVLKGSCRSDGSVSVVALMHEIRDSLIEFGGHHAAGGFAVRDEHVHVFSSRLNEAYTNIKNDEPTEGAMTRIVDAALSLEDVTRDLYQELRLCGPFGVGNEKPSFVFRAVVPQGVATFGKGKDHVRATFARTRGTLTAIGFFSSPESFQSPLTPGTAVDLIGAIEESSFNGRSELRLRIIDVLPAHSI